MSLETPPEQRRVPVLPAHEARQRLEHERNSRLAQLTAMEESGHPAEDQLMAAQMTSIRRVLKEIEEALVRVDEGTYGVCQDCNKPIPVERLEILPYARACVSCQQRAS